ncbi:GntR family transcriptional regulator [Devosia sp. 2618]|uniref:GntR family transcriptional regulator n=1 Tax=Devosia sp. 2618 TaxID=3156454 RepID=UPI003399FF3A
MSMAGELAPVSSRMTIADGVYQQLRDALMVGRFDPGQTLTISALATTFGTSHMPVREALRRLAAENALEVSSGGSARVPAVSVDRLDDLCRARVVIEGLATELAASRTTPAVLIELRTIVAEHEALSDEKHVYDMLDRNRAFHFAVYRQSGSEVLLQIIDSLWLRYGPYMRMLSTHIAPLLSTGLHEPFTMHHHEIIKAMERGDGAAAKAAMVADITDTLVLLRQLCERHVRR